MPIKGFRELFISRHNNKLQNIGYFIPFNEYVEEKLGINISSIIPAVLDKLIHLMNIGYRKKDKEAIKKL